MQDHLYAFSLVLLAGICLYSAIQHCAAARRSPQARLLIIYAAIAFLAALIVIFGALSFLAESVEEYRQALRACIAAGLLFYALFPWLFAAYSGLSPRPVLFGLSGLNVFLFFINLTEPGTIRYDEILALGFKALPWGERIAFPKGNPNPWGLVVFAAAALVLGFALYALIASYIKNRKKTAYIMIAAVAVLAIGVMQGTFAEMAGATVNPFIMCVYPGLAVLMGIRLSYELNQERGKIEDALRHKTALLEAQLNSTPDGIIVVDAKGKKTLQNKRTIELWKIPRHIAENPDDSAQVRHVMHLTKNPAEFVEKITYLYEHPNETTQDLVELTDGTLLERYSAPVLGPEGQNYGRIWNFHDITDQRLAERKIRDKDLQFRKLSANVPDLIFQFTRSPDGSYRVPIASNGIKNIFGCSPEDVVDDFSPIARAIYPEDAERVIGEIEYSAKHLTFFTCEFRVQVPGRDIQWIYSRSAPEELEDGSVTWYGFNADITDHKKAEEAIATEKERLSVTLRSIGDGVITTDTLGKVLIMNKVAEEYCGWKQDEAQGKPLASIFKIIDQGTRKPLENPVEIVLTTGQIKELADQALLVARDGSERIIADSGAPIKDKDGKTIGVVLVFRDMTEKQRLLDNAQRTDKLESIGVLAGGIAHDFNNLLGGLFGYIELAQRSCAQDGKTSEYLRKALKTFARAKDLTQQLLTFAKGGAPIRKAGDLSPILKDSTQFALSGSNVAASYLFDRDLWLCEFDENQLGQAVDNLVINAVQAMPLGGNIKVAAENREIKPGEIPSLRPGDYVHVSFADTGVGIPKSILPRIFDPFFTTKQKGNGLGLAIVYSIIKKHDGEITVESETDKGTTFHFYLPVTRNAAAGKDAERPNRHKGAGRILIMDDEESIRETVGGMLGSMGYDVEYALGGDEALEMIRSAAGSDRPYKAAIMDLTIPGGMGGKETISRLRKTDRDLAVFVSSGYSENPVMANPTEYGFTDRISKPFREAELSDLFSRHFGAQ